MTMSPERRARIILSLAIEPPAPAIHELVDELGAVDALHQLKHHSAHADAQNEFTRPSDARVRKLLAAYDAAPYRFVIPSDNEYPRFLLDRLADSNEPTIGFWAVGDPNLSEMSGSIAITGTESLLGLRVAPTVNDLATNIARSGNAVVGRGHHGVAELALHTALATDRAADGQPVVVLGHGLNTYDHRRVVEAGGLILTEYAPDERPTRRRLAAADRIVAALGGSTIVVAPTSSPSHTHAASVAAALGHHVLVWPGGTQPPELPAITELIARGAATILSNVDDLAYEDSDLTPLRAGTIG